MSAGDRCRAFARARTPVAVAMRAVAASLVLDERAAGDAPLLRRSVFLRHAAPRLEARFVPGTGGPRDEDLH